MKSCEGVFMISNLPPLKAIALIHCYFSFLICRSFRTHFHNRQRVVTFVLSFSCLSINSKSNTLSYIVVWSLKRSKALNRSAILICLYTHRYYTFRIDSNPKRRIDVILHLRMLCDYQKEIIKSSYIEFVGYTDSAWMNEVSE